MPTQTKDTPKKRRLLLDEDQRWVLQAVLRRYLETTERTAETREYRRVAAGLLEEVR